MSIDKEISIIIPVRNEEAYIRKCLDSLVNQTYPQKKYEIIVIDGMSTDKTREIVSNYHSRYQKLIKLFDNEKHTQVIGRNIGIRKAEGNIVIMFSGHAYVPPQYLSIIDEEFRKCNSDVVAIGANIFIPEDESLIGQSIAKVQNTIIGGASSAFRISKIDKLVDSPGFPAYRKEIINKLGFFDERFVVGEDIDLNWQIKKAGYKLMLCSNAVVYYYRRHDSINLFCRHMFNYGKARGFFIKKHPNSIKLINVIPLMLILFIMILPLMFFYNYELFTILLMVFVVYSIFILISSINILQKSKNFKYIICIPLYYLEHLCFGIGIISGFIKSTNRSDRQN